MKPRPLQYLFVLMVIQLAATAATSGDGAQPSTPAQERSELLQRGEAALARGDVDQALDAFERAGTMMHAADAEMALVRAYMQSGAYRRAPVVCCSCGWRAPRHPGGRGVARLAAARRRPECIRATSARRNRGAKTWRCAGGADAGTAALTHASSQWCVTERAARAGRRNLRNCDAYHPPGHRHALIGTRSESPVRILIV